MTATAQIRDFTIPEGCVVCGADLPVRVTAGTGPRGVCVKCGWMGRPRLTVTARGFQIEDLAAAA